MPTKTKKQKQNQKTNQKTKQKATKNRVVGGGGGEVISVQNN